MKKRLETFISDLKRRKVTGAYKIAVETAEIMYIGISSSSGTASQMMDVVRRIGEELIRAAPLELSIGNVMRRVLFIIREQYHEQDALVKASRKNNNNNRAKMLHRGGSILTQSMMSQSLSLFAIEDEPKDEDEYDEPYMIREEVQNELRSFIDELGELHGSISKQALEHIHEHEVVLTFGRSNTVAEFLKFAAPRRQFHVMVAETAPSYEGRETALQLSQAKIHCTVIPDAAVFAMMARVNKVIIGVRAVLANGGLLAHTGAHMIAMAAKAHHVPLVVLSGLYKFTPLYPSEDQDTFSDMNPPEQVLPFDETDTGHDVDIVVQNPAYDYVPPNLVSLYISNQGGIMPPYIYQILAEYYHPSDLPELNGPLNIATQYI